MFDKGTLDNQIALVTGASRGIGRAVASALGALGATVIGTGTTPPGASSIDQYLNSQAAKGRGAVLDVNDAAAISALLEDIERDFGHVSILVNNAGITQDNLAIRMKDAEWDSVIDTDLKSVFRLSKAVLRGMIKARTGRIINVTSVVGAIGNPGQINYAAAKAGVAGLTRSLAREVGSRGITVNCVSPGFIQTDMTSAMTDAQRAALLTQIPLARLGGAEEVAAAVCFLSSPSAAYITGSTIHVNGGMFMN
ncbi:MAG: 3-oxoacyl-ACP reductase FabG [Betaproteobacteria bacterium]|nr:3-oxoacyl-ACP reductase FabG [Betaproteobacteria bacterium]